MKETRYERRGEWLVRANTQKIRYFSIVATQDKTKERKAPIDES